MPLPLKRLSCGSALLVAAATRTGAYGVSSLRADLAVHPPTSSSSSPLFRQTDAPGRYRSRPGLNQFCSRPSRYPTTARLAPSPTDNLVLRSSNDDESDNGSNDSGSDRPTMTLLEKMDSKGQKLKPMALEAKEASVAAGENKQKRILYTIKSCALFTLFILYRAYRGFFVLLPAVFRETYAKMETAVSAPFIDESDLDADQRDINPETGKVRFRTRFTVSVLSLIVTMTYVISGAWRILAKFATTVWKTASLTNSVEAAADEVLDNEDKIERLTHKGDVNGDKG